MARAVQPRLGLGRGWVRVFALAAMAMLALNIFRAPEWRIQVLESPDGEHAAELRRFRYTRDHFKITLRRGWAARTVYTSPAITNAPSVDLRERLLWHPQHPRLYFALQGGLIWGMDVEEDRALSPERLAADALELADRVPR